MKRTHINIENITALTIAIIQSDQQERVQLSDPPLFEYEPSSVQYVGREYPDPEQLPPIYDPQRDGN